jgi:hypothetical protein
MASAGIHGPRRYLEATLSTHEDRETMRLALAGKSVVCRVPGMEAPPTRRGVTFRAASDAGLLMEIYYPSAAQRPPFVVLPMAYPDPAARVRTYGPFTSWARLLAASGMAAAVYGTESPAEDVHAVLRHVRANADGLGVDPDRIGCLASSGNATVGLSTLMRDRRLACAAFLYGYTMDLDGSTAVADASARFGFVDACAGRSFDDLPSDVPMLFVRAGHDGCPGLNPALDAVVRRAIARNLPVSFVNHAAGAHGFDLDDSTAGSRRVVRQVLAFLQLHLEAPEQRSAG